MKELNAVDFDFCLLDYYKKLKITEDELAVVFMIEHLLAKNNFFITADMLALRMNFNSEVIDGLICSLLKKGYLEYIDAGDGKLKTSIEPLKKVVYQSFGVDLLQTETPLDKDYKAKIENLYREFEKSFKRSLAPVELDKIDEWLHGGYAVAKILYALKTAELRGKLSIRSVEKSLLSGNVADDVASEGYSLRGSDDNLDETTKKNIEILKTRWTDDK